MAQALDTAALEKQIKELYAEVALQPRPDYFHFELGRAVAERLGYSGPQLDAVPAGAVESFAGVGYFFDLAAIGTGETVLDLGSGSGTDSLLAARQTGESGRVIGVDMTDAQREKAARLAAAAGFSQVEFRAGYIDATGLPDGSVDVVISNGVVNLAPDKPAVFREVARVLRPGGRLALADIVSDDQLPAAVTCDASLWAACIGGAVPLAGYRDAVESAGLRIGTVRDNDYEFRTEGATNASRQWGVRSISLLAHRP